jgi:exosortase
VRIPAFASDGSLESPCGSIDVPIDPKKNPNNDSKRALELDLESNTATGSKLLGLGVAATLFLVAYSPIGRALESGAPLLNQLEYWFFDTSGSSAGLMACLAAWATWRRLPRLLCIVTPPHRAGSSLLFLACLATFVWAERNEASDLLFVSLALLVSSLSFYLGGATGIRTMVLPIVILFLALPIPHPLNSEIVWSLQNWSAAGTEFLLKLFGVEVIRSGAELAHGEVFFLVIEGCSGLRSILTLTTLSLVIRELFEISSTRGWALVLAAPFLAITLNIVRIAAIVLGSAPSDQTLGDEHLGQGLVVFALGTSILFTAAHYLGRTDGSTPQHEEGASIVSDRQRTGSSFPVRLFRPCSAMLAILCLASVLTKPWPPPTHAGAPTPDIPMTLAGWSATTLDLDYPFLGMVPRGFLALREYDRKTPIDRLGPRSISVLITADASKRPRGSPVSTKHMVPGRSWQLETTETSYNYVLGHEISVSRARTIDQRALVYSWSLHDDGFWKDSARSLLALERGPFERARHRVMVRMATIVGKEAEAEEHAKQILDRFVHDFREPFRAL